MLIRKYFLTIIAIVAVGLVKVTATGEAEKEPVAIEEARPQGQTQGTPFGLSIKLLPALYWGTLGLQVEYPVSKKVSVGIMVMAKKSDSKNYGIQPENYQDGGFLVDVYAKYFFLGEAPEGLYGFGNLSYNSMLFFDGNTRPYTLQNRWKDFDGFRVPSEVDSPKAFNLGVGVGYQLVIIPRHIIADVYIAASGNLDSNNSFFLQLYLAPSLGFIF